MTQNWYVERDEGNGNKARYSLLNTPGLAVWLAIGQNGYTAAGKGRGIYQTQGRTFAVVGTVLWEIMGLGIAPANRGTVANDGQPVSWAANAIQLAVASGGTLYVLTLANNAFASASVNAEVIVKVGYSDGFGIALVANSNKFYVSAALDFTTWVGTNVTAVSVFPDLVLDMLIDHREIWLLGQTKSTPYYNSGGALFPYDVVPGGYVDQGTASIWGSAQLDNTLFWVGNDTRGTGIVWKMAGYTPQRVSNHAVENDIREYQTRNDCVAYGYTEAGHAFFRIVFPTAGTCWTYDTATGMWHQRAYWNTNTGKFQAPLGLYHTYNDSFNAHLVLDSKDGTIYRSSIDFQDDAGNPIRRVRRSAYISQLGKYIFFSRLEIETDMGLGPIPPLMDGQGNPRDPMMMVRWSNDGANTWSNEYQIGLGQAGKYGQRAYLDRLGRCWGTKGRIFELSMTDPGPRGITEASVEYS
jgi:hypothetical protein